MLGCGTLQTLFQFLAVVVRTEEQSIKQSLVLLASQLRDVGLHNIYEIK